MISKKISNRKDENRGDQNPQVNRRTKMTFAEITRVMLNSMDFFQLRRTAKRYEIPFQGIRRQKLIRDLERRIVLKSAKSVNQPAASAKATQGAVSARPVLENKKSLGKRTPTLTINTFSARNTSI